MPIRATLLAAALTGTAAALEGLAAGGDIRARLAEVRQPKGSPPLSIWIGVGALYYITGFIVAVRLLSSEPLDTVHAVALGLLTALLLGNALWNAVFFRRRDLGLGWKVSRAYALLALGLAVALWRVDRLALWVFLPYLLYLVYGTWWVYKVWQLNPRKPLH
jgi:benzodiazapine receptor